MRLLGNHSKDNEWKAAVQFYSDKQSEVKSQFSKEGTRFVNQEAVLKDHVEGRSNLPSETAAVMSLFGGM